VYWAFVLCALKPVPRGAKKATPGAFVQAWGGWASAKTLDARKHQLIPWEELELSPPDSVSGPGDIAPSSAGVVPRAGLHSIIPISIGIFAGWYKLCVTRVEAEGPPSGRNERVGTEALTPRHAQLSDAVFSRG